jgi:hypothetical protein
MPVITRLETLALLVGVNFAFDGIYEARVLLSVFSCDFSTVHIICCI